MRKISDFLFFFFNDTATTEIYTLSLHDALPISRRRRPRARRAQLLDRSALGRLLVQPRSDYRLQRRPISPADRKSTRLNSSHSQISYAVFCLKKKRTEILVCSLRKQSNRT